MLARVSDSAQAAGDRMSLPAQLRQMRERCEREGWAVVKEFVEEGVSGYTRELSRRPGLLAAVDAAERGEFDVLLVHDSSRFARQVGLHFDVKARLERAGVMLLVADQPWAKGTADSFMVDVVTAGVNEYWSRKISEHIKKAKRERYDRGLHVGDVPFGYRRGASTAVPLEVVTEEAEAVRQAFVDRAGGIGPTEIARRWNAAGFRPHSKQGLSVFTSSSVSSVLENDFYCGFVRHLGERRVGAHEAVIEGELWAEVQARERVQGRGRLSRSPRALSGVARCSECDGPLWLAWSGPSGQKYAYYREAARLRQREACPNGGRGWRADEAERLVGEAVTAMALDDAWLSAVEREARRAPAQDVHAAERAELARRRKRAMGLYIEGQLTEEEWRGMREALERRLREMPAPLPGGVVFTGARLRSFGELWEGMTQGERREVCGTLFKKVAMDVMGREIWLEPWEEFEALFRERRRWLLVNRPRQGTGAANQQLNRKPWLYLPRELVAS